MPENNTPNLITTKPASHFGTSEPSFLWKPFLPYKKLVVLQGESGIGKSSFILNIAALLSRGESMPFEPADGKRDIGDILYFNNEDDVEETVNPRLIAMGADLERFHFVREAFYLDNDCSRLEATINELNARLVIIDPLTSFLSKSHNMNTAQSVGNLMRALSRAAFTTGAVIVVVCHLVKNASGKEIDRHLGSSDIINAARSVLSVTRNSDDCDIVTVKHLKSTLAKRARPFCYEIVGNGVLEFAECEGASICSEQIAVSKNEMVQEQILSLIANGPLKSTKIYSTLESAGVSRGTIYTAKKDAAVLSKKRGGEWFWHLPGQDVNASEV